MDVPLFWKELARMTDSGERCCWLWTMFLGVYCCQHQWSECHFSNFLKLVSMPGCRALKTGSFFMPVSHQSASGMSHAES
eukprot:scaffold263582_cov29-Tisochrysis_lutea.AAC.1